jgi:hypothetical protein
MKTNEIKMNTCPKCGSPQESPKLDGTTARIWFVCGSYGYAHKPHQLVYCSDKCLDREEINDLQRKVEELESKLDDLQASIHSCGDSCSRPMCVLRMERNQWRECAVRLAGSIHRLDPTYEHYSYALDQVNSIFARFEQQQEKIVLA